ncbi:MAG: MarR family transcriptional regulator [Rhizobiaceae bacterium]|nr:MAG: MarR family transcriptional regulator [Rhizobiaceae bacterium]CAG0965975.1 putative N-acetyltransferase YsnE [Rhizobiaceae bacterium]
MDPLQIECVRSFNRLVSQRIGALDDSYLARGRPLGEARVIFEAGLAERLDLRRLREKLGLDSGYLSRLVRSLEAQGIAEVAKSAEDGRVRELRLTAKGRAEFEAYDAASDRLAEAILAPLAAPLRKRLATAMAEVERLLRAGAVEITIEPAGSADARWCLQQYYSELAKRFDEGFDPSVGSTFGEDDATPPAGWFLVARSGGEAVGCGALKRLDDTTGEIKRVWTAASARGLGVASRIMDRLEAQACAAGFKKVLLDTNRALVEAHALYSNRSYREIGRYNDNPYAHHWFEKAL